MPSLLVQVAALVVACGVLASGCAPALGIEEKECGGCATETSRLVCSNGVAEEVPCPTANCGKGVCSSGQCSLVPDVGKSCGETGTGTCNDSAICVGPDMKIGALRRHACLVTHDAEVWCWGDNQWGEVGDGSLTPAVRATRVVGLPVDRTPVDVGLGYAHACAVMDDGSAWCWGNNLAGQCGVPPSEYELAPVQVDVPGVKVVSITGGYGHSCALSDQATLHCWGFNEEGQCGVDGQLLVEPSTTPLMGDVARVGANKNHTCAVRQSSGTLECWGRNEFAQLARMPSQLPFSSKPVPITIEEQGKKVSIVDVALGYDSTRAVGVNGRVYSWGLNTHGQLGTDSIELYWWTPNPVIAALDGKPLVGGLAVYRADGSHGCARSDHPVYSSQFLCWGANQAGEVGIGTKDPPKLSYSTAQLANVIPNATVDLAHGEDFACMLLPGTATESALYEVQCFGDASMLAIGAEPNVGGALSVPTPLPVPIQWKSELAPIPPGEETP